MVQKGLKEVGYSYVNVDDGFFGWRDERVRGEKRCVSKFGRSENI